MTSYTLKTLWIAILTFVAAGLACVARLPIDGAKCPCPTGYCCVAGACVPSDGLCDKPVTQDSGTAADLNVSATDAIGSARLRKPGESCDIIGSTSDCEEGSACISAPCGLICHKLCTSDDECGGGTCDLPIASGSADRACRAGTQSCDPIANSGCRRVAETCFVEGDHTYCDCLSAAHPENAACVSSINCFPGLSCVPVLVPEDKRCRRICALGRPTCLPGTTCVPIPGNTMYGSCQ